MKEIELREAKAKLSAVVDEAVRGEPWVITRHGQRIPRSWNGPHPVIFKGHGHFYARSAAGKYRLDVDQLYPGLSVGCA